MKRRIIAPFLGLLLLANPAQAMIVSPTDVLNVRQGPGTEHPILTTFLPGEQAEVIEDGGDWLKVEVGGVTGWVAKEYTTRRYDQEQVYAIVDTDVLNVRQGPGTDHAKFAEVLEGQRLRVVGAQHTWYQVELPDGRTGWVLGEYLEIDEPRRQAAAPPVAAGKKVATVATDVLNVRDAPSTAGRLLSQIVEGERYEIIGYQDGFVQLRFSGNTWGWVSRDYVTVEVVEEAPEESTPPGVPTQKVATLTRGINLRREPRHDGEIITWAGEGQEYVIIGYQDGYVQVRLGEKQWGWLNRSYVTVTERPIEPPKPPTPPTPEPGQTLPPPPPPPPAPKPSVDKPYTPRPGEAEKGLSLAGNIGLVREGRSVDHKILEKLNTGAVLTYLDSQEGWFKVTTAQGTTGWIYGDAVQVYDKVPYEESVNYLVANGTWRITQYPIRRADKQITMYEQPGGKSKGTIRRGSHFKVLKSQNGWWQVSSEEGWVSGWVREGAGRPVSEPALSQAQLRLSPTAATRLEVSNLTGKATVQADGNRLLVDLPGEARDAWLRVEEHGIERFAIENDQIVIDFESEPNFKVLANDGTRLVVELRSTITEVKKLAEADRDIYRVKLNGHVYATYRFVGKNVEITLQGASLGSTKLPSTVHAREGDSGVVFTISDPRSFLMKRSPGQLDLIFLNPGLKGKVIVVDPGHGGPEPGTAHNGLIEKNVNLNISRKLAALLQAQGATVIMTRTDDTRVADPAYLASLPANERTRADLDARTKLAQRVEADLFISIHGNAGMAATYGTETFYAPDNFNLESSKRLATLVQNKVAAAAGRRDRGVKSEIFYVIRYTEAPAVLLETLFLSNPQDAALLANDGVRQKIAEATAEAIAAFFEAR